MIGPQRLSIVISGTIAADELHGGAAWAVLQYVLGFMQLGHEVCLIEPVPRSMIRPSDSTLARSETAARFRRLTKEFGFSSSAALLVEGTTQTVGLSHAALRERARRADVLINISGLLTDPALLEPIGRRVYLDLDPAFNQAWQCGGEIDMRFDAHTHFATVGLAVGRSDCLVPTCGRHWITTCPPVLLREWPVALRTTHEAFTTVGSWRSYGVVHHDGMVLGQKVHALRPQRHRRDRVGLSAPPRSRARAGPGLFRFQSRAAAAARSRGDDVVTLAPLLASILAHVGRRSAADARFRVRRRDHVAGYGIAKRALNPRGVELSAGSAVEERGQLKSGHDTHKGAEAYRVARL